MKGYALLVDSILNEFLMIDCLDHIIQIDLVSKRSLKVIMVCCFTKLKKTPILIRRCKMLKVAESSRAWGAPTVKTLLVSLNPGFVDRDNKIRLRR